MAPLASSWRGGFQGYLRRASGEVARQFMTHSVTLPPSNDALRKVHPIITSSAMTRRLGRNTTRKRPSILQRVG